MILVKRGHFLQRQKCIEVGLVCFGKRGVAARIICVRGVESHAR